MYLFDSRHIALILNIGLFGMGHEESVVRISSGMGLRLEEGIKVPKWGFDIPIGFHLLETHFSEYLFELGPGLHKDMQVSIFQFQTFGFFIELFELKFLPSVVGDHRAGDLCLKLDFLLSVVVSFFNYVICLLLLFDKFPFFHFGHLLF